MKFNCKELNANHLRSLRIKDYAAFALNFIIMYMNIIMIITLLNSYKLSILLECSKYTKDKRIISKYTIPP